VVQVDAGSAAIGVSDHAGALLVHAVGERSALVAALAAIVIIHEKVDAPGAALCLSLGAFGGTRAIPVETGLAFFAGHSALPAVLIVPPLVDAASVAVFHGGYAPALPVYAIGVLDAGVAALAAVIVVGQPVDALVAAHHLTRCTFIIDLFLITTGGKTHRKD